MNRREFIQFLLAGYAAGIVKPSMSSSTINYNINDSEVVVENLYSKNFYCKFPSFHRISLWHKYIHNTESIDDTIVQQHDYDMWFRNIVHHSNLKLRTKESFDD